MSVPLKIKAHTLPWFCRRASCITATDAEKIVMPGRRPDQGFMPSDLIPWVQSKLETLYAARMSKEGHWTEENALAYIQYHQNTLVTRGGSDLLLRYGSEHEAYILKEYAKHAPKTFFDPEKEVLEPSDGLFLTNETGELSASPDAIVVDAETRKIHLRFVEAKCPFKKLSFNVPVRYWLQMQQQMLCAPFQSRSVKDQLVLSRVDFVDYISLKTAKQSSPGAGMFVIRVKGDDEFQKHYEAFAKSVLEKFLTPIFARVPAFAPRPWKPIDAPPADASAYFKMRVREQNGCPEASDSQVRTLWFDCYDRKFVKLRAAFLKQVLDEDQTFEDLVEASLKTLEPFIIESEELRKFRVAQETKRMAEEAEQVKCKEKAVKARKAADQQVSKRRRRDLEALILKGTDTSSSSSDKLE